MPEITLVITSCKRHDLLERTLRSFERYCGATIKETVIVEDSDLLAPSWLTELKGLGPVKWITNGVRKGQIYSCDRGYAEITTPYIFHCEDDWEFTRSGFIEESLEILEKHANILQVWMRDDSAHPVIQDERFPFPIMQPDWEGGWSGFAFNPGLRRMSEYRRIGSFGRHVGYDTRHVGELALSKLYYSWGFYAAKIPEATRHIGDGPRHIAWETAPTPPKVLIAIPACHKYEYGKHPDARIDHRDRVSNDRVEAIRATWQNDVAAFKSYVDMKFFYGEATRAPLEDEVFLPVADDYDRLPHKIKAIYQWALEHGYDYIFKADDDTFVYVDRLMASGFEGHDYLGFRYPAKGNYVSGGPGYWLSARAMRLVVDSEVNDWAEDRWVGKILAANRIPSTRDARYLPGFEKHYVDLAALPETHGYISFHACTPEMMRTLYETNSSPTFLPVRIAVNEGTSEKELDTTPEADPERVEQMVIQRYKGLRILIAILSCHQHRTLPDMQRKTWLRDRYKFPVDYRYFLGRVPEQKPWDNRRPKAMRPPEIQIRPMPDQVLLDAPDDYDSLPLKTYAMLAWAYARGYDYVFKADDDTYCRVDRLLESGFEKFPYSGFRRQSTYFGPEIAYGQGGAGYWLDRKAMEFVLEGEAERLRGGPEDINVARILKGCGIALHNDVRYQPAMAWPPTPGNDKITAHLCTPEEMQEIHQKFTQKFTEQTSASRPQGLGQDPSEQPVEHVPTSQARVWRRDAVTVP